MLKFEILIKYSGSEICSVRCIFDPIQCIQIHSVVFTQRIFLLCEPNRALIILNIFITIPLGSRKKTLGG